MVLPSISPREGTTTIHPEPLTPSVFAPFGTVITSPLPPHLTVFPPSIPKPLHPNHQPQPIPANQATALKTSPISPLTNNYPVNNNDGKPGVGLLSIFSCFPRQNTYATKDGTLRLKLGILERHPYTTQTFCPFNYSSSASDDGQSYILVVVAPTLDAPCSIPANPPDLANVRAFLAPLNGSDGSNMAVTYAPGTWHAPMIVLGSRRVDFLVTQFANGVGDDDCQEVLIGSGPDENILGTEERAKRAEGGIRSSDVEVDVSFLVEQPRQITVEAIHRTADAKRKARL